MSPRAMLFCGLIFFALAGCQQTVNPSFSITRGEANAVLNEMAAHPVRQVRPLVVLGGWRDILNLHETMRNHIAPYFLSPKFIAVGFGDCDTFEECRKRLLHEVNAALLGTGIDPSQTAEVDVVAFSMGGVVARYTAAPPPGVEPSQRLRIARLFTIASPHRGASSASLAIWDSFAADLHDDSPFILDLAKRDVGRAYPIYPYVWLGDGIVGPEHTAPPGEPDAWWLANPFLETPHVGTASDPRILADIIRRLRGEKPLATEPRAPLP